MKQERAEGEERGRVDSRRDERLWDGEGRKKGVGLTWWISTGLL